MDNPYNDLTVSNVELWRAKVNRPATFTEAEIKRWNYSRHGAITQTARGSHIDICVRLCRWSEALWPVLLTVAGALLVAMMAEMGWAIVTGRVQAALKAARLN